MSRDVSRNMYNLFLFVRRTRRRRWREREHKQQPLRWWFWVSLRVVLSLLSADSCDSWMFFDRRSNASSTKSNGQSESIKTAESVSTEDLTAKLDDNDDDDIDALLKDNDISWVRIYRASLTVVHIANNQPSLSLDYAIEIIPVIAVPFLWSLSLDRYNFEGSANVPSVPIKSVLQCHIDSLILYRNVCRSSCLLLRVTKQLTSQ